MSAIILRSDLRCPKKCDGRIIEKRGGFGKVEYLCDRCKIAVQPVPRMRLSGLARKTPLFRAGRMSSRAPINSLTIAMSIHYIAIHRRDLAVFITESFAAARRHTVQ